MSFEFPQTAEGWIPLLPALITLILGAAYFFFPKTMLQSVGLVNVEAHPEAIGEGRSSFAGPLLGCGLVVALFHDQPILNALLGLAWTLASIGMIAQVVVNGRRNGVFILRIVGAAALALMAFVVAGGHHPLVSEAPSFQLPHGAPGWMPFASALLTTLFGLICFLSPDKGLAILRLQPLEGASGNANIYCGEVRGLLGGFYLAIGGVALIFQLWQYPYILKTMVFLTLGFCWGVTAFGRMISMLVDGGSSFYYWLALMLELVLAALPLLVVFGLVG